MANQPDPFFVVWQERFFDALATQAFVDSAHRAIQEAGQAYHEMILDQRWPVSDEVRQAGCRR